MKKVMAIAAAAAVVVGVLSAFSTSSVEARPKYNGAFEKTYVKADSPLGKALGGKSNCNVCHVGSKDKKTRNDFGKALEKTIGEKNEMDEEKIVKALAEAAKMNSKADDKKSPTFADLIEKGTLPVTKEDK